MQTWIACFLFFFFIWLPLIPICCGKRGFILTSPKIIDSGSTEQFCLTFFDVPHNGMFSLSLKTKTHRRYVARTVSNYTFHGERTIWIDMHVPPISDSEAFLHFRGRFSDSDYRFNEIKLVKIRNRSIITFVQTDKPVYKPGQTVKFRILSLDNVLKPLVEKVIGDIWIEDSGAVRIAQWKNISFGLGITQLELPLSEEPVLGEWAIKTLINGVSHSQTFKVDEYVLPKFEVIITAPNFVMADSQSITAQICAQYTYGKKVDGMLKATASRKGRRWFSQTAATPLSNYEGTISGCHQYFVNLIDTALGREFISTEITIFAEVTENGTDITRNASVVLKITEYPVKLKFLSVEEGNKYFKPGLPFYEKLLVSKPDRKPAIHEEIEICANLEGKEISSRELCKVYTSNAKGEITFFVPAQSADYHTMELTATATRYPERRVCRDCGYIRQPRATKTLKAWFSPSGSHLQIEPITQEVRCEELKTVRVRYTTHSGSASNFYYQIISRGRFVQQGLHRPSGPIENSGRSSYDPLALQLKRWSASEDDPLRNIGEFMLTFRSQANMSPISRLLVFYARSDGEVVADSRTFRVTPCFLNKASLNFRYERQYPSTEAGIFLSASPLSLCGIGVVDKSVHLMQPDKQINKEKIFELIESYDVTGSTRPIQTSQTQGYCRRTAICRFASGEWNADARLPAERHCFDYSYETQHVDTIAAFEDAGMVVMSDFNLETRPCYRHRFPLPVPLSLDLFRIGIEEESSWPVYIEDDRDISEPKMAEKTPKSIAEVRNYFPETWLWEAHAIGESGATNFSRKLPDTITEWVGSAICIHPETGLGISDTARITAFQPFFVSFTLPYSVIRNEIIPVIISVFNYLTECLPIKLSLESSEAFEIVRESRVHKLCVCGGQSKTHKFYIRPVALGHVNLTVYGFSLQEGTVCGYEVTPTMHARDAATRQLLVEAEGFPKEETFNSYFCLNSTTGLFRTEVDLLLPENVVEGSARAFASVTGDLMAQALNKLDGLVRLPTGCGEQNMILFVPNIFVLDYLTATGRITVDIKSEAMSNMITGYQRELRYRHSDGSYSAFGKSDREGSMWLTAFVVRSFSQARRFMSIDENDLLLSTKWIVQKQTNNGCFNRVGRVLNKEMKGGLSGSGESLAPLTAYALMALLEAGYADTDVLRRAVQCLKEDTSASSYSLALFAYATALAKDPTAQQYLQELESRATTEGNLMYWRYENTVSKSIDVEISAYAILAMLEFGGVNNVPKVLPIVRWIAKQRNANGGFVSTQDTVVALQALAKYAVYNTAGKVDVDIAVESDELRHSFKINESNKLTMQNIKLPVVPTVIDLQANGEGCALSQFTLRYNVQSVPRSQAFDLNVSTSVNESYDCNEANIEICMRYNVEQQESNMVVATVKMISGYVPDERSLQKLQKDTALGLKRHDVSGNQIHFYFSQLTNQQKCFQFVVKRELEVEDAKPAIVKIYDYYQTESEVTKNYEIPSSCAFTTQTPEQLPTISTRHPEDGTTTSDVLWETGNIPSAEIRSPKNDNDTHV